MGKFKNKRKKIKMHLKKRLHLKNYVSEISTIIKKAKSNKDCNCFYNNGGYQMMCTILGEENENRILVNSNGEIIKIFKCNKKDIIEAYNNPKKIGFLKLKKEKINILNYNYEIIPAPDVPQDFLKLIEKSYIIDYLNNLEKVFARKKEEISLKYLEEANKIEVQFIDWKGEIIKKKYKVELINNNELETKIEDDIEKQYEN